MHPESIRTRTIIVLLAISLLIILVIGGLWVFSTYQTIKNDISTSNLQDARLISGYVGVFLNNIAIAEMTVAGSNDLKDAINRNDSGYLKSVGDNLDIIIPNSDVVIILDKDGKVLYHSKGAITTEFVLSGLFDRALEKNGTYISDLYLSSTLKNYVFAVSVPVVDQGSTIGYIVTSVDPVRLNQEIQNLQLSPERNVIVVDSRGLVVSHNVNTYVEARSNLSDSLPIQYVLNGTEGVIETSHTFDRELRIVGFSPVPLSGWGVVASTPMSVAYRDIFKSVLVILALLGGVSLLIILISYFISGYLTDPIIKLSETMQSVSAGKYKVRAGTERKDEIGDLSRTFNSMMDELERTVELEHATEILKKYQLIFQQAGDTIVSVDINGRILDVNNIGPRVYGYTRNEFLSMTLADLTIPEEMPKIPGLLKKCFIETCKVETVHRRKDGSTFPVEINAAGTKIDENQMVIAVIRDITDRKKAEDAVVQARNQAEKEKERAIEESQRAELYLDIMGHDINNLNQTTVMNLELIKDDPGLTSEEKQSVDAAYISSMGSSVIIDNVRKLQQITTGKLEPHRVDLNDMILSCITEAPRPANKKVVINYTPKPGMLVMGASLLKEVFCNLLNNSIKYSGEEVTIDVQAGETHIQGKKYYQITIADNGHGIPDEVKLKLFTRFQRGTTKAHGKGLGLYIVRSLLEKFEGSVKVEDRVPGDYTKGSKFLVTIPATEVSKNG